METEPPHRPILLDLFCGAGGASMGYHRAGFKVIGVDNSPQPRYPFDFVQGDAIEFLENHGHEFDVIHASPPCRDHSRLANIHGLAGSGHLLSDTRDFLSSLTIPWVIENVPGADMRVDLKLCGCMFDLPGLRRLRFFETNLVNAEQPEHKPHVGRTINVNGHPGGSSTRDGHLSRGSGHGSTAEWRLAMGIDWMSARSMAQAIPPAYTEYIGQRLMVGLGPPSRPDAQCR